MTDEEQQVEVRLARKRLKQKAALIYQAIDEIQGREDPTVKLDAYLDLDSTLATALQETFEIAVGDVALKLWHLWRRERCRYEDLGR